MPARGGLGLSSGDFRVLLEGQDPEHLAFLGLDKFYVPSMLPSSELPESNDHESLESMLFSGNRCGLQSERTFRNILFKTRYQCHGDVMHSIGNRINNTVIVSDGCWT